MWVCIGQSMGYVRVDAVGANATTVFEESLIDTLDLCPLF